MKTLEALEIKCMASISTKTRGKDGHTSVNFQIPWINGVLLISLVVLASQRCEAFSSIPVFRTVPATLFQTGPFLSPPTALHHTSSRSSTLASAAASLDTTFNQTGVVPALDATLTSQTPSVPCVVTPAVADMLDTKGMPNLTTDSAISTDDKATASVIVDDTAEAVPNYKSIIAFVSTTVLIWLSEPLLSLVDTTVVGQFASSAAELTALGPATMMCDSIMYSLWFLAIATTNQLTTAKARKDEKEVQHVIRRGMGVALLFGVLSTVFTLACGNSLLYQIVGGKNAVDIAGMPVLEVVKSAFQYSAIRSLAAPFTVMGMVAQAICLASRDMRTPILAVLVASIVNVCGDLWLVKILRMGSNGAALATAAATILSTLFLLKETRSKYRQSCRKDQDRQRSQEEDISAPANVDRATQKDGTYDYGRFVALPTWKSLTELVPLAGPIFGVMMGKIICYNALTLKANTFGMLPCATNNILRQIYFFFGTFGDAVCQAAQTFFPGILYAHLSTAGKADGEEATVLWKKQQSAKKGHVLTLFKRLFTIAATTSVANALLGLQVCRRHAGWFTSDSRLTFLIEQNGIWMALSLFVHPFALLLEGTLIAGRDVSYLAWTYLGTLGLLIGLLKSFTTSFSGVWKMFFAFQTLRMVQFSFRVGREMRQLQPFDAPVHGKEQEQP
jgi:Na+-driven multidrug efflux pump